MSLITLRNRFASQPQRAALIDYAGLARGMRILWNPAAGPVDLVTGRSWAAGGNASIVPAQNGKVFSFDGADDYYAYTGYPELTGNVGTFFMWCPTVGGPDTYGHCPFGASSPNAFAYQVYPDLRVAIGSNGASSGTLSSWFNTKSRSIVFVSGGTAATCKVFLDGKEAGLTWTSSPVAWGAGNKNFNLGRYVGGNLWEFDGTILIAGFADSVWGAAESRAFHENPWQLFKASARKLWPADTGPGLSGVAAIQANRGSTGEIAQHHTLAVAGLTQAGGASTGKIEQDQILAGASLAQSNLGSAAGVTRGIALAGALVAPARTLSTGKVSQAHMLSMGALAQGKILPGGAITQTHILIEAGLAQSNAGDALPISIGSGTLVGTPSMQANAGGTGVITQIHILSATFCIQINKASAEAISDGVVIESALFSQPAEATYIKKPGIPVGTPPWLKTMLEILTGRRGNRIALPAFRALTFSAPPTRAECEALYAYINSVRDSLEQLISRMDG
ncbi:hypothetical protein [Nitrosospira multiformis]|uniref:hypothetical protein n=1 Tax=Nitrosospira multiformis TaxID=1231 RepID=UPI0008989AAC|nr:hypothetical protein [Nitrosospira multiformis]SDZ85747.1 hypothetical protein SAMN05216411_102152 [Nitrosospira multiformis]